MLSFLPVFALADDDGPPMSEQTLRHCVSLELDKDEKKAEMNALGRQITASESRLNQTSARIDRARARLERSDLEGRRRLDEESEQYGRDLALHNDGVDRFNEILERRNALVARFNDGCTQEVISPRRWVTEKGRQRRERRAAQ